MSLWNRLFGKTKMEKPAPRHDIPEEAMKTIQTLRCDPKALDPAHWFTIGKWNLSVAADEESQRLARGVLKKSAGKTLRLEPNPQVGHRGVISSTGGGQEGKGYRWLYVDVDLRAGTIAFQQGGEEVFP